MCSLMLEPCPSCGCNESSIVGYKGAYYAECRICGTRTHFEDTPESAAGVWNTRKNVDLERARNTVSRMNKAIGEMFGEYPYGVPDEYVESIKKRTF